MALPSILTLEVATPKGLALSTQTTSVQAPSVAGEFGVLPGHVPLLAALRAGVLRYVVGGKSHVAAIGEGFAEATPEKVVLLTESFEAAESINADAVQKELSEVERSLRELKDPQPDDAKYVALKRSFDWAEARLAAARSASAH